MIALGALGIQCVYLLAFLFAFRKRNEPESIDQPPVSVIVCAHDEEENLRHLIPLLLSQDYPEFEVIVVEDRSNDNTYDYLLQATKEDARLKMVVVKQKPEHINGKKFALTLGIKAARHAWVLLTDADSRPASPRWIARMATRFDSPAKIVLGFSPYIKTPGLLNAFIRFESILAGIQFFSLAWLGKPYMGVGRNLAYQKSLFLDNKGFNTHLGVTGGDDDLFVNQHATRDNTTTCLGAEALVFSQPKASWKEFFHQKFRHLSVGKNYKFSDRVILGLFTLSWILVWLLVLPVSLQPAIIMPVAILFLLRWVLLTALCQVAANRFGDPFEVWKVPFLDFMYAFYYLVTGVKALFVKNTKWKI